MTRPAARIFAWSLAALALIVVVAAVWIGVRGALAAYHLVQAREGAVAVAKVFAGGDADAVSEDEIADLRSNVADAHALTSDPIWRAASALPWIGPQLDAFGTAASAAHIVTTDALPALLEIGSAIDLTAMTPQDGRIDPLAFTPLHDPAAAASAELAVAAAQVERFDTAPLLGTVSAAFVEFRDLIVGAAAATDALERASVLLPAMLGADGPRDYLLLIQNNAEWRSLGGIPGSLVLLHTDDGVITLTGQAAAADFEATEDPILPLAPDVQALFGEWPGRWMHNVTQVPDFSVGAEIAQAMWRGKFGIDVDGVLTIDPVALSYLLAATGPITLPTGDELTSENAVDLLLNEVYFRYSDPLEQNLFFAASASAIFDALTAGTTNPTGLLEALGRAGAEHRILIWNADADEQAVLAGTTLAGELPVTDAETARFGVYLNDGTGSKMSYYLDPQISAAWLGCSAGMATASLSLTLVDTAPPPEELPPYITGDGESGVEAGIARTVTSVYLPYGWDVNTTDAPLATQFTGGFHDGYRVVNFTTDLRSGESATAVITASGPASEMLEVVATPTIASAGLSRARAGC